MVYKKIKEIKTIDKYNELFEKNKILQKNPTEETCTIKICSDDSNNNNGSDTKICTLTVTRNFIDFLNGSKHISAYNTAADTRKFEIELFWKRATFFWAFITAIYTAYFYVLTNIYKTESVCTTSTYTHGTFPLIILSALGLFFCVSWLFTSKGSKHWQENWESHLDLLEDDVTGPIYKTFSSEQSYSVSKVAITAGWVVSLCAYGLLIYEFMNMIKAKSPKCLYLQITLSLAFALFILLCLLVYSRSVIGNQSERKEFSFFTYKDED